MRRVGKWFRGLKRWQKAAVIVVPFLTLIAVLYAGFGSAGRNQEYQPQNEFQLDPWVKIKIGGLDLSINKAVLYLFLAAALTSAVMIYIAKRMQERPNNVQTAVEAMYDLANNNITRGNMPPDYALKWFPVVGTLFFFIWFSNLIGYIPLPTNSMETTTIFGLEPPRSPCTRPPRTSRSPWR